MKKLLTILLALLLPMGAMAETFKITVDLQTGGEAFLQAVQEAMLRNDADENEDLAGNAKLLQRLLDGTGLDLAVQKDAFAMEFRLAGERLVDMIGYLQDQDLLLTSQMIPGYALTATRETPKETYKLEQTDWVGVALSVFPAVNEWCNALETTESYGLFVGDAYEGGAKCTTWVFDDQAVAKLVNVLLTEDIRAALMTLLAAMELDGASVIRQIEERTAQMAQDNLYTYLLRWVQDAQDQTVGLSLTVLAENEQVATVSIGSMEDGCRVVLGLGLQQQNYWNETTIQGGSEDGALQLTWHSREWASAKEDAFAYISTAKEPETDFDGQFTMQNGVWQNYIQESGKRILLAEGTVDANTGVLDGTVLIGPENAQLFTIAFTIGQADEIPVMDATLKKVSMTEMADQEQYEKVVQQLSATLMVRLIKLLPLQMIMEMNPITLP